MTGKDELVHLSCQDKYESQKLASIIYLREKGETFLAEILNVSGNEVVVALKDKSAHSIVFGDERSVNAFVDFVQPVIDGSQVITGTATAGSSVEITKSDK